MIVAFGTFKSNSHGIWYFKLFQRIESRSITNVIRNLLFSYELRISHEALVSCLANFSLATISPMGLKTGGVKGADSLCKGRRGNNNSAVR